MPESYSISRHRFLSLTIFAARLNVVDETTKSILNRISPGNFERLIEPLELSKLYELVPPAGGAHLFEVALYSPRLDPNCSVMMTNIADGWSSLVSLVSEELATLAIQIISSEQSARYPMNRFEVWQKGVRVRSVMAMKDSDRWKFVQLGEVEPFEEPQFYENGQIRERLTREIMLRYLARVGWDIRVADFWEAVSSAIYYDEQTKLLPRRLQ